MSTEETKSSVIRYSKEVMIALHDSPLVQKPESMPSLLVWFGEDPDSPTCKNILNGSYMARPTSDRSIILGPTKTNFASSLYGGLKKSDDNTHHTKSQSLNNSSKHNNSNRQLDDRTGMNGIRSPRGPSYMGEKGFSHRSLDSNKSHSDRKYMGSSPPHNKRNDNRYDTKNKRESQKNRHFNNNSNNYQDSDNSERVPEWMDYTPEIEQETTLKEEHDDTQAQFANDLEAWKSNMKKRDGIQEEKVESSFAALSLEPQPQPADPLAFFEDTLNDTRRDQKGSSRFAKFFAKREVPTTAVVEMQQQQQSPPPPPPPVDVSQGRSISVNDLFNQAPPQQQVNKNNSIHLMNMLKQEPQQQQQPTDQGRVFSEEDVLKSLGANKKPSVEDNKSEDVIGFNRVLQILSQPKPMLPQQQQSPPYNENSPKVHKGVPLMTGSPMGQTTTVTSENNNKSTSRFGSNLPTSVLRQMSARSSEGKSPSLKSTPPPPHHNNIHLQQQQQQQQHLPNGIPLPPHYMGYHPQQPMYSPGHPAMMDPRTYEQFVHGGMPPPPHMMMMPPLPPGQRPMMTPPPHLQQLPIPMQGQQRFPPHMTNGIPPQLFNKNHQQGWEQRQ